MQNVGVKYLVVGSSGYIMILHLNVKIYNIACTVHRRNKNQIIFLHISLKEIENHISNPDQYCIGNKMASSESCLLNAVRID